MRSIGVLLFDGFELLDVFGPLEMFGLLGDDFVIRMVSQDGGPAKSNQGPVSLADDGFGDAARYDLLLVPGGSGSRKAVQDETLIAWLREQSQAADLVTTVCTGSAILARTGLLDGRKATTNKLAFEWVASQGPAVDWQPVARWVEDGKYFSSSGVSAGMDMALAVIAKLHGEDRAAQVATWAEYDWHRDAAWDPFAKLHGLAS